MSSPAVADRFIYGYGYRQFEQSVKISEIIAKQLVETRYHVRRVIIAQPPEPVRAFAGSQLPFGLGHFLTGQTSALHHEIVTMLGRAEQVPGAVFVAVADPCGKCSIYPTAGRQYGQSDDIGRIHECEIVAISGNPDRVMVLKNLVEIIEKIVAVVWIVFPGIFSVENHTYHRVLSGRGITGDIFE